MMDSKLLTLIAIAQLGSFSRAAKAQNLTQPAVSSQVKEIEKEIGSPVFLRTQEGLKLTAEGQIVLKYARRIKAVYDSFSGEIESSKKHLLSVAIGVTHTAESSFAIEALAKYANDSNGLRITFVTGDISFLYDKLNEYAIDLAIVEGHNNDPRYSSLLLDTDTLLLAVSPLNPLAKKTAVTLEELRKEKMIVRGPSSGTRRFFEASIASKDLSLDDFDVSIQSDSIATIKDLVIKNIGVSVLARSACLSEERKKKLVLLPIEGLAMIREVNLVYLKDWSHPEVLSSLVKFYKAEAVEANK